MTQNTNVRAVVEQHFSVEDLSNATTPPNLVKWIGKQVFVLDLQKPAWSVGYDSTSPWVDATGAVIITPTVPAGEGA